MEILLDIPITKLTNQSVIGLIKMSSESESEDQQFDQGDVGVTFSKHFILQRIIGKGAFGTVVAATLKSNLKDYAVKVCLFFIKVIFKIIQKNYLDQAQYDSFMKEADILGQLNHPNIVKFVKIIESETRVFLVMELVKGGQLQEYIEERKAQGIPFTDEEVATIMRSIFSALQNIHSKDVIHRDLKPRIFFSTSSLTNRKYTLGRQKKS